MRSGSLCGLVATSDGNHWRCERCGRYLPRLDPQPPRMVCLSVPAVPASGDDKTLIVLRKGLGDAVQLTPALRVLRDRGQAVDVVCMPGQREIFRGLAGDVFDHESQVDGAAYSRTVYLDPPEPPFALWHDSPSTKAAWMTRRLRGATPPAELLGYHVATTPDEQRSAWEFARAICASCLPGSARTSPPSVVTSDGRRQSRFPLVLVHYHGHSFATRKNLPEADVVRPLCRALTARGFRVVMLDRDGRSRIEMPGVYRLRSDDRLWAAGQTATLWRALVDVAALVVGIDSGPGHVAAADNDNGLGLTPCVIVSVGQHPLLFFEPAPHVTHLVPHDHARAVPDPQAREYFARNYQWREYFDLGKSLPMLCEELLTGLATCEQSTGEANQPLPANVARPNHAPPAVACGPTAKLRVWLDCWTRGEEPEGEIDRRIAREQVIDDDYRTIDCRAAGVARVLDIGAHAGMFLRRARHRWGVRVELAGVEPNPASWPVLAANAALARARVLHAAVGYAAPGETRQLVRCDDACMTIAARADLSEAQQSRERHRKTWQAEPLPCEVLSVEAVLERLGWDSVDGLKIDCEGSEREILEHVSERVLDACRYVIGEWHGGRAWFSALVRRRFVPRGWRLVVIREVEDCGLFRLVNEPLVLSDGIVGAPRPPRNSIRTPALADVVARVRRVVRGR